MKKVGILTLFEGNYNYGGVLQSYALCKTINNLGHECKVISYEDSYNPIYPSLKEQLKQYKKVEILNKICEKVRAKIGSKEFKNVYTERAKLIKDFKNTYIPHTKRFNDEILNKEYKEFDVLVSGSDQVWNPNCSRKGFLQLFPHDSVRKVSYAASISRSKLSDNEKKIMIPAINDFDYIGVREKTAKEILEKEISKKIYVTADPTLLLDKKKWLELNDKRTIKEDYVLCYFFSNSIKYRQIINKICELNNLKLIYIPFAKQEYNNFDIYGDGIAMNNVSPSDFISLVNNAKYVFTDSFHGAVFSLIFEKQFLVFERDKNTKVSMNSRLYDLLEKVKLSDRMVTIDSNIEGKLHNEIDFSFVNNELNKYKEESMEFLKKALN